MADRQLRIVTTGTMLAEAVGLALADCHPTRTDRVYAITAQCLIFSDDAVVAFDCNDDGESASDLLTGKGSAP